MYVYINLIWMKKYCEKTFAKEKHFPDNLILCRSRNTDIQ